MEIFGFLIIAFIFSFFIPGQRIWQFRKWTAIALIGGLTLAGPPLIGAVPLLLFLFGIIWYIKYWAEH